jgi:hypothetical protein
MRQRIVLAVLLGLTVACLTASSATATQANLSGAATAMAQTNGTVWALASTDGTVFAGGDFTSVRPAGVPGGTGETSRGHLAAFDATTGDVLPFHHELDGRVRALAVSADGSTLYVGGSFTHVDGIPRGRLAAFNIASGSLTNWKASVTAAVYAIVATAKSVYVGGLFTKASGQSRAHIAAFSTAGGLRRWAPAADKLVTSLALTRDGSRLIVGGSFDHLNFTAIHALGAVDPSTGATIPWLRPTIPRNARVKAIEATRSAVYVGAEGRGLGIFDGTLAATPTGRLIWFDNCLGATQAVAYFRGYLYAGSHAHDCSMVPGGFPQIGFKTGHGRHLQAEYASDGHLAGGWFPTTDTGPNGGVGPHAMLMVGSTLYVGGDFSKVNDAPQQGIARFTVGPDVTRPRTPIAPTVISTAAGVASLSWPAVNDLDDKTLTYRVYRDGGANPIGTVKASSFPWTSNMVRYRDAGLTPGSSHTYRVSATDTTLDGPKSPTSATVTIASADPSLTYSRRVLADHPLLYWRLSDKGTTAADSAGNANTGIYRPGTTPGVTGAIPTSANTAVRFDGITGVVASTRSYANPQVYSLELWFKTRTIDGGKLIGFSNTQLGASSEYDRQIWMLADGQLEYGIRSGSATSVSSPRSYNDGSWHQVDATQGPAGMALYVDGALVGTNSASAPGAYTGYWRVGGGKLDGWADPEDFAAPSPPSSHIAAAIDEVAIYSGALTGAEVAAHYAANPLNH